MASRKENISFSQSPVPQTHMNAILWNLRHYFDFLWSPAKIRWSFHPSIRKYSASQYLPSRPRPRCIPHKLVWDLILRWVADNYWGGEDLCDVVYGEDRLQLLSREWGRILLLVPMDESILRERTPSMEIPVHSSSTPNLASSLISSFSLTTGLVIFSTCFIFVKREQEFLLSLRASRLIGLWARNTQFVWH